MVLQGGHALWKTGKTGKMINKNSLQGKIREFENFMKIREKSGNFENPVLICLLQICFQTFYGQVTCLQFQRHWFVKIIIFLSEKYLYFDF